MAEIVTTNMRGHVTRTDRTDDASAKAIIERYVTDECWHWLLDTGQVLVIQKAGLTMTATLETSYVR